MFESLFGGSKSKPQAPAKDEASKPKPCCVCKEEKAKRDECMLFADDSSGRSAEIKCQDSITAYRLCMESYGFKLPAGATA